MSTLIDVEGFAHKVKVVNPTATFDPPLWNVAADVGNVITFPTGLRGDTCVQIALDGTNAARLGRNPAGNTVYVASFKCRLVGAAPTGATARVFCTNSDLVALIGIGTDGNLRGAFGSGTGAVTITGPSMLDNRWHHIDVRTNSSPATHTLEWIVDGVAQSNASAGGVAATNTTQWWVGNNIATATCTIQVMDVVVSQTSGDYPLGKHQVFAVLPVDDNAASVYGTNVMEQGNGTDLSSSNKGYQYLDEWPPTTGLNNADTVTQVATGAGNFVDVEFANAPAWAVQALAAVTGVVAHQSDGTAANSATSRIVDSAGTTLTNLVTGDMSENSAHYTRKIITAPGGGWSITNFNGARGRVGFASDAAPQPEWLALMLQGASLDNPQSLLVPNDRRRRAIQRTRV